MREEDLRRALVSYSDFVSKREKRILLRSKNNHSDSNHFEDFASVNKQIRSRNTGSDVSKLFKETNHHGNNEMKLTSVPYFRIINSVISSNSHYGNPVYKLTEYKDNRHEWRNYLTWPTRYFLTVTWSGGLGDALFTYASLLGIARRHSRLPIVNKDCLLKGVFNISFTGLFLSHSWRILTEDICYRLEKHSAPIPSTHIKLRGRFQRYKYFDNVTDILRRELTFYDDILISGERIFYDVTSGHNKTTVGVNIDYGNIMDEQEIKNITSFITRAIKLMQQMLHTVIFLVSTDDVTRCRQWLPEEDMIFLPQMKQSLLLVVLSRCEGSIVTRNSIGWWSAWLSNGYTVYDNPCLNEEDKSGMFESVPGDWIAGTTCD